MGVSKQAVTTALSLSAVRRPEITTHTNMQIDGDDDPRPLHSVAVEIEIQFEVDTPFAVDMVIILREKCGEFTCGRGD